jgi:hypothetical protein
MVAGARHLLPHCKRPITQQAIIGSPKQMLTDAKEIVNLAVNCQKALCLSG